MRGDARPAANGLTEVRLEDGTVLFSTDQASGRVGLVVYPWEVALSRSPADGSALNSVAGEITSLVLLGNRVRIRVGPLVAEVTAERRAPSLARGETVVATFKATAHASCRSADSPS